MKKANKINGTKFGPAMVSPDQFLDPVWRINNLYTIINKSGKSVLFQPWDEQREFLQNIHSRNLILKCRQRGITTLMCIIQLDDCVFNPNVRAAVIAHKLDDAKVIFRDKVKYPYDMLDAGLKAANPLVQDSVDTLTLANNSSFRVSTSVRSGTLNWLHISEYGKICAIFPEKAQEIRTGSFPATENGVITIESTAEGEDGDFYKKCQHAQHLAAINANLTKKDFRFFFYPWWRAKEYAQPRSTVPCSDDDDRYFAKIENDVKTTLTKEQRNWWLSQEHDLGGDMKREYPSTPEEAFEQALEGAIFINDIAIAYKHHRIGHFPVDPTRPVNTFWDLGFSENNETSIWLEQDFGDQVTFVGYYENSGEGIEHYVKWLKEWSHDLNLTFGQHYLPHDGNIKNVWIPEGSMTVMNRLGFRPTIVRRISDKLEALKMGHRKFGRCAWDEDACKVGLKLLKRYRKEWNPRNGTWRDKPYHGPESNCADAYLTFAQSNHIPIKPLLGRRDRYHDRDEPEETSWMVA